MSGATLEIEDDYYKDESFHSGEKSEEVAESQVMEEVMTESGINESQPDRSVKSPEESIVDEFQAKSETDLIADEQQ